MQIIELDAGNHRTIRILSLSAFAIPLMLLLLLSLTSIGHLNSKSSLLPINAQAQQQGELPTIRIPEGAAAQTVDTYYIPETAQVQSGSEVTWVNEDTAPHTSTSGTPTDGPSGLFDTGIIQAGQSASVTITSEAGTTIPYYCTLHPWMTGTLQVISATTDGQQPPPPPTGAPIEGEENATQPFSLTAELEGETYVINGTASPELNASSLTINPGRSIEVEFQGNATGNVNLTIPNVVIENITSVAAATQNGQNITFTVVEQTPNATTIGFEVPQNVTAVHIMGIGVVPEFQIALLLLTGPIFAILVFTRLKMRKNDDYSNNHQSGSLFGG